MIAKPIRQALSIGDRRLTEPKVRPDFGAVPFQCAICRVGSVERLHWYTKLLGYRCDDERVDLRCGVRKSAVPSEEQKQHAKRQPTIRRLSPDERHVGDGQRPGIADGIDGLWLDLQCSGTHVAASDIVNSIRAAAGYSDRAAMPNWLR